MKNPLVSIIMPVFNAEQTLKKSLYSIFNQTYTSIEILIVNDCSTDNSLAIARDQKENNATPITLKIIQHEKNEGVAFARNTGLDNATGKYIYWVDADDWIEKNAIELFVKNAEEVEADIVGCNWYLTFRQNERKMNQTSFNSPKEAITKMTSGVMRWNLWLFIARRSLYETHQIRFLPNMNMGEDMMVMIKLFAIAKNVCFVDKALYHYNHTDNNSISSTYTEKQILEVSNNIKEVEIFLGKNNSPDINQLALFFLKLNIKLPLLFTNKKKDFLLWKYWFPESNNYVMQNKMLPLRTRIVQWCAYKGYYLPVKLYNMIIIRFIYGIIYK